MNSIIVGELLSFVTIHLIESTVIPNKKQGRVVAYNSILHDRNGIEKTESSFPESVKG